MTHLTSDADPLGRLVEEFLNRFRQGERPAISEFTERHPDLEERIREYFPLLVMMESAASGIGASKSAPPEGGGNRTLPEKIGGYHILREIGRGGMGVVYEAEQVSLGRHVALKVLPRSAAQYGSGLERFRREARAVARLHHTNFVPVFEVGHDDETAFYAMQLIHGQPLDAVLREIRHFESPQETPENHEDVSRDVAQSLVAGVFTRDYDAAHADDQAATDAETQIIAGNEITDLSLGNSSVALAGQPDASSTQVRQTRYYRCVAHVGIQVAEALDYAHSQGVLHRDIKPSNLLLDTQSRVWITDFGLAKTDDVTLTREGDLVGTLRYMPPERFRGHSDARSDIYALGLTLYEMLTLRPAFDAEDHVQLMKQVANSEPRPLVEVDPGIPRDLETIVQKTIDHDPARRYRTAAELATDLRSFLDHEPMLARRTLLPERIARWCKRNPVIASLGSLLFVSLVAGIFGVVSQWRIAVANETKAAENADQANEQRDAAQKATTTAQNANAELRSTVA